MFGCCFIRKHSQDHRPFQGLGVGLAVSLRLSLSKRGRHNPTYGLEVIFSSPDINFIGQTPRLPRQVLNGFSFVKSTCGTAYTQAELRICSGLQSVVGQVFSIEIAPGDRRILQQLWGEKVSQRTKVTTDSHASLRSLITQRFPPRTTPSVPSYPIQSPGPQDAPR